jgi:hypothetical protein
MTPLSRAVGDFFGHPFVVVVIGALVTGVVVNYITHRWQERQRERELKTDLVANMTQSVHTLTMTVLAVHQGRKRRQDLEPVYDDWRVRSAVIGAKLEAYFAGTGLRDEWSHFSKAVNLFYRLERADPKEKNPIYGKLRETLPTLAGRDPAESELRDELSGEEDKDWVEAKDRIGEETSGLVQKVLGSDISRIGHSFRLTRYWRLSSRRAGRSRRGNAV